MTTTTTSAVVEEMRAWLLDCTFADADADDIGELSPSAVLGAVERHYDGGTAGFLAALHA